MIMMKIYEIRLKGQIGPRWAHWFDGLRIVPDPVMGETTLTGPVADQAALHGLLNKIRDLGLEIMTVTQRMEESK